MNIKIEDESVVVALTMAAIDSTVIGSQLYGTANENSDTDTLVVHVDKEMLFETQHQLQYVDSKGNDFMFTSLKKLIANILSGDQTVTYEAAFNFNGSLAWLSDFANEGMFDNFKIINAYLGFAKRDIKNFRKKKSAKKLFHIIRGIRTAERLLGLHDLDNNEVIALAKKEAVLDANGNDASLIKNFEDMMIECKTELTNLLDLGNIELTISKENAKLLETKYEEFINGYAYTSTEMSVDTSELYYDFQFNGAKY
jgi:predicted nucleotidyltransferase